MALPARGYSWPSFTDGNKAALQHGAYSARTWRPLADRIAAELVDIAPWCARPTYGPAVSAWARTEAQLQLVMSWLDHHGPLDGDGAPRPATALLAKLEAHARELRNDLGLSPLALAKLLSVLDSAPAGTDDAGLEQLKAQGHRIVADRTAALEAEAASAAAEGHEDGRSGPAATDDARHSLAAVLAPVHAHDRDAAEAMAGLAGANQVGEAEA